MSDKFIVDMNVTQGSDITKDDLIKLKKELSEGYGPTQITIPTRIFKQIFPDYVDDDKTDYQAIADEMNDKLFKKRDNHE